MGTTVLNTLCTSVAAILEVEDPSDKVVVMVMMEGLCPSQLFDSLSKNVPKTWSMLQSKADKYIATDELVEAKRRRQGKDDHKRKDSPRHNQITSPFDEIDPLSSDSWNAVHSLHQLSPRQFHIGSVSSLPISTSPPTLRMS